MGQVLEQTHLAQCGVCNHSALDLLWNLPKLPLTEKYGIYSPEKPLHWDQQLLICDHCGHVQLGMQISPALLYTAAEYSFRTSQSKTARIGTERFLDFYLKIKGDQHFHSLLDVGGNDRFLAQMIDVEKRCVVDPVCSGDDGQIIDGVKIIGKMIEQVDFQKEDLKPDLIFCRHVLEHVSKPKELLLNLFSKCHPDALYVFEIPCFENLMEANRFDAIFHQHYHYFDVETFQRLILEAGGQYLAHAYNRQGSCGGALLIAFRRAGKGQQLKYKHTDVLERKTTIKNALHEYRQQMSLLSQQLQKFRGDIYGYGASLMLATLAYHLNTDFSELICVLDDDQQKNNIGYQNIPVRVRYSGSENLQPNCNYLITSLENTRNIFRRLMELSPRRVLVPLVS
jgi:hypothetical protein